MGKTCGSSPSENIKLRILEDRLRKDLTPKDVFLLNDFDGVLDENAQFYTFNDGELKHISWNNLKTNLLLNKDSINGITIEDGYWVINGESTGVKATGPQGEVGLQGIPGINGIDGKDGVDGVDGQDGKDGETGPQGERGPQGEPGKPGATPYIGVDNNWWIADMPTYKSAVGPKGDKGDAGADGHSPIITIDDLANWRIDGKDTGVSAKGPQGPIGPEGKKGDQGLIGPKGDTGAQGERGFKGETGTGIKCIVQTIPPDTTDYFFLTIEYTDNTEAQVITVQNGKTPYIGDNGNWWLGNKDLNKPARGEKGEKGDQGEIGPQGPQGDQGIEGRPGKDGRDGKDGKDAELSISVDGKWVINGITTGTDAQGPQGEQGIQGIQGPKGDTGLTGKDGRGIISLEQIPDTTDKSDIYEFTYTDKTKDRFIVHHGRDGEAPEISKDETWVIKGVDTGKPTRGKQGPRGDKGERGPKGDPSDTDQVIFSDTSVDGAKVLKNIHLGPVGSGEDWKVDNAGGATPEQIAQIDKNKNDIANLKTSKLDTIKLATINGQKLDEGGNITIEGSGSGATPEQIAQIDKNKKDIESLNLLTFKDNDIITKYNPIFKSYFKGKKLWVLGDSITYGVGTTEPNFYPELLAKSLGCALTKKGYSGYAYGKGKDPQYVGSSILTIMNQALAKAPGNCDILLVALGINDWTWGTNYPDNRKIGNLFDNTEFTIAGAVNIFCQKIKEIFKDYPNTEVYLSTPLPTSHTPIGGGAYTWDQSKTNFNGDTLRDICRIIIKTGAAYGFKILDMNLYFDADINNHSEMESLYADGLHLNELGNQRYALSLEKILIANPITQFTFNTLTENLNPLVKNIIYQSQKTELPDIPKITLQPQSATYKVGESPKPLLITATATNGMLSYKWFKNNQLLSESSNSLNISLPNEGQSDDYYCLVTNTLNNLISEKKSDTITITTKKKPTGIDLNKLSAKAVNLPGTSGDMLSYNKETHDVTTNKFGWNYSSYIDAPLHVGDEIELTNINFDNGGTTGNLLGLITTEEITNPKAIAGSLWAGNENFGLYIPGAAVNAPNKWDKSKQNFVKGELNGNLKGTVIIKIKQEGIEFYDNGRKVKLPNTGAVISSDKTYYLYGHHNGSAGARAYTISYMGEIR